LINAERDKSKGLSLLQKREIIKVYGPRTYSLLLKIPIPPTRKMWGTSFWETSVVESIWKKRIHPKIYGLKKNHLSELLGISREWMYHLIRKGIIPKPGDVPTEDGVMTHAYSLDDAWDLYENLVLPHDEWRNRKKLIFATKEEMIRHFEIRGMRKSRTKSIQKLKK